MAEIYLNYIEALNEYDPNNTDIKKYWDSRPCNVKGSNKTIGTKEYFEEIERRRYFVEPHIVEFADFSKWNQKEVLEIGVGIGTDSINFVKNGAKLTGIELSEESLKICKERFNLYNFEATFLSGNCENLIEIIFYFQNLN